MSENEKREGLRRGVMDVLGPRYPHALPAGTIMKHLERERLVDFAPGAEELTGALEFCREMTWVEEVRSPVGASSGWKATAAGVLAWERGI